MLRNRWFWLFAILLVVGIVLAYVVGAKPASLYISVAAEPVACLGGTRASPEACASGIPITNSLILTVITDLLLLATIIFGVRNMQLIPRGFQNTVEAIVEAFYNFAQGIDRKNVAKFFPFCASVFFFVLYANFLGLVPGVGSIGVCAAEHAAPAATSQYGNEGAPAANEAAPQKPKQPDFFASWPGACAQDEVLVPYLRAPSADLNMTAAWALTSVFLIQVFGFQALGMGYLSKFFNFREGAMGFIIGILELVSEFVRIIAFAFRLFGNIFAGEVVLVVMAFLLPYVLPLPFYGLEVFVAFIQAVIFSVLSLVFMSLAVQAHGGHEEHGHAAPIPVEAGDVPGHSGH